MALLEDLPDSVLVKEILGRLSAKDWVSLARACPGVGRLVFKSSQLWDVMALKLLPRHPGRVDCPKTGSAALLELLRPMGAATRELRLFLDRESWEDTGLSWAGLLEALPALQRLHIHALCSLHGCLGDLGAAAPARLRELAIHQLQDAAVEGALTRLAPLPQLSRLCLAVHSCHFDALSGLVGLRGLPALRELRVRVDWKVVEATELLAKGYTYLSDQFERLTGRVYGEGLYVPSRLDLPAALAELTHLSALELSCREEGLNLGRVTGLPPQLSELCLKTQRWEDILPALNACSSLRALQLYIDDSSLMRLSAPSGALSRLTRLTVEGLQDDLKWYIRNERVFDLRAVRILKLRECKRFAMAVMWSSLPDLAHLQLELLNHQTWASDYGKDGDLGPFDLGQCTALKDLVLVSEDGRAFQDLKLPGSLTGLQLEGYWFSPDCAPDAVQDSCLLNCATIEQISNEGLLPFDAYLDNDRTLERALGRRRCDSCNSFSCVKPWCQGRCWPCVFYRISNQL